MRIVGLFAVLSVLQGTVLAQVGDVQSEERAVQAWRAQRLANLTGDNGWLTLVGLFWLKQGENPIGRATSNAIRLDYEGVADSVGAIVLDGDKVRLVAQPASKALVKRSPVTNIELVPDTSGEPTIVSIGSLRFYAIERVGKLGIRVRDVASPARTQFKGLQYFPIDTSWSVNARFEPYKPAKRIAIVNILGMTEQMESPGAVVFERDGNQWRLDAVLESPDADELFIMFADATTGRQTYGAGRYIYVPKPKDEHVPVDFNRAYNPPCAFSEFATCPLPPRQNRLALSIAAGEKKYP